MKIMSILLLTAIVTGCASRQSGWDKKTEAVSMSESELKSLTTEAKALWSQRADTEKLKASLAVFEKLHAANPQNLEVLIYLTRGNYFLADAHLQEMDKKKEIYEKAAAYGEKAMATNSAFRESVSSGKSVEDSLGKLTAAEVPAIYWTAASLGKWAKSSGIAAQLKYKPRITGMIQTVEKLQPDYFFGAVPRYWGAFYAVAPSFAGGDMKKSKQQFDRSLAASPEYIGTRVLMAEVYWTKQGDRKQFESMLKEVIGSNFDNHPELGPENMWEKKKAEKLLKNADELF